MDVEEVLKKQLPNTRLEFEQRTNEIILQLNEKVIICLGWLQTALLSKLFQGTERCALLQ
jgi:hypothetical protein